jgi:carbon-monoxide dehydrogenase large subunit
VSTTNTAAGRYIGQSVKRREDPRLLTGHGRYLDDFRLPGMLHAAFVRSNVARGRIVSIDAEEARALPGVVAVYTAADLHPRLGRGWSSMFGPPREMGGQLAYPPAGVLAETDVRYVGDPVAIVVAESRYIAEDAADMVIVDVEPERPVISIEEAATDAVLVHPEMGSNLTSQVPAPEIPPLEEVFATAPHVFSKRFHNARMTNVPMETRGIIAGYDPYRGTMEIKSSNQGVHEVRSFAARLVGIPESKVHVQTEDVGGAFGQKMLVLRDESAVIAAAYVLGGAPIKWAEDRRENLFAANQARSEFVDVSFAVSDDHRILGAKVHFFEECGAYPPGGGASSGIAMGVFTGPYKIPMLAPAATAVFTNTVSKAPYRGPWAMETIAREQMMDHVAAELGIDPIEFRRINLIQPGDLPYTTATMMVYDVITPTETLEQAVGMIDVAAFRAEQAAARAEGRYLGLGVSSYVEPSAIAFGALGTDVANISMDTNGKVLITMGTGSHGHSLETTIPQIVAEHLGCDIEDVFFVQGDSNASPNGPGTGGSRSAVIAGGAATRASVELRDKLVAIAAKLLEADPADLEAVDGAVSVKGTPAAAIPFAQLAMTAHMAPAMLPEGMEPGLEMTVRYAPPGPFTWSNAAHACIVEVDPATGIVKVLRYVVSEDCGQMINPMVVEGQVIGGVVQGIGEVLFEHLPYDADGNPLATTFLDYLIPTAAEVPDIEVGHVVSLSNTLGGYKGMGEGGAIAAPPAVANAVNDALSPFGVRLYEFPFSPNAIVTALAAAGH